MSLNTYNRVKIGRVPVKLVGIAILRGGGCVQVRKKVRYERSKVLILKSEDKNEILHLIVHELFITLFYQLGKN